MNLTDILQQLQPALISVLGLVLTVLIGGASQVMKQRFGIEIEARHREALHSALMSGISAAIEDGPGAGKDVLIEKAVTYARESVPDAIAQLRPSETLLRRLVMGKLKELGAN
ncbi:hypothetical protein PXK58_00950 [Phaeobacter gallaeciensis]|uniref:hypothetical protein n=1 Tax=Phaeobacter gallaeciensis TaxID=60890 RepID=UPI0023808346|nr:hypothetical protein [Phaeobacter gallaeciensis]MDE4272946.1 hypothetical protein [Phaeobacter gallaeciensis]MDE4298101.1 hypothetical protein [Phaeobacter gallaeciensis]MDE5183289.1 hypothetical protein [Phaeobacter gallaeciensis]